MGVLLLLRHGQASLGSADYDQLSELGAVQARYAGARLAQSGQRPDRIVCGGLRRQRDTTSALIAMLNDAPEPVRDERLDEYDHEGVLAAHTAQVRFDTAHGEDAVRAVQPALEAAITRWADVGPEVDAEAYAESHDAFVRRCTEVVDELAALPGCKLAVTSGGVIGVTVARLLGLSVDRWPALARVTVNASITKIVSGRSGTNLITFNDHAHLEPSGSITYR